MFPGLTGIRQYGYFSFLATALVFALLLDGFLIANFYWTAYITPNQRNIIIAALVFVWVALNTGEGVYLRYLRSQELPPDRDEKYKQAVALYLQRDWIEAEALILPYLQKHPKDAEMRLLQATIYRHSERYEEAAAWLAQLELFDGSKFWFAEIEAERRQITALQQNEPVQ
ncbi:hypothetical protein FACS1894170_06460 [Planctomycetales bacterium]|nr:hypothetical protein FACS1894170_06460 [Planctomycetales bacterium]